MKLFLECIPCMLRQIVDVVQLATTDESTQQQVIQEALQELVHYPDYRNSPDMLRILHPMVKRYTGISDPYARIKQHDIEMARGLLPKVRAFKGADPDRLLQALKISAIGNLMDSAIYSNLDLESCIQTELSQDFSLCDLAEFKKDLQAVAAKGPAPDGKPGSHILIIGDNAGEAVFDTFLIECLQEHHQVTYAVRDVPIINDVTLEDAQAAGLTQLVTVISSGSDAPGTLLERCSPDFLGLFNQADIVISKGQGNYETLSDAPREIYFLLKAKCKAIANALETRQGSAVFFKHCT
ncbi:MAG: DUF89 family protein [Clostridia bacterium]|nr:DUF89 family protein [Clostridia bacterium]